MLLYMFIGDIYSVVDDLVVLLVDFEVVVMCLIFLGDYIDGMVVCYFGYVIELVLLVLLKVLMMVRKWVWEYGDVVLFGNYDEFWLWIVYGDDNVIVIWVLNGGYWIWCKLGIYFFNFNYVWWVLNGVLLKLDIDFLVYLLLMW